jgi:glutathione peroxidase-family protein
MMTQEKITGVIFMASICDLKVRDRQGGEVGLGEYAGKVLFIDREGNVAARFELTDINKNIYAPKCF